MLHQTQNNAQNAVAVLHSRIQSVYALHALRSGVRFMVTSMLIESHHYGVCAE